MPPSSENSSDRIVPLFPDRRVPRPLTPSHSPMPATRFLLDAESTDRLLRVDAAMEPLSGEGDGVAHIRHAELGVSTGAFFPHVATEDVPEQAAGLGFQTLEIMLNATGEYEESFAHLVRERADAAGVRIRSLHTIEFFHSVLAVYPRRVQEAREMMRRAFDSATIMGAEVVVWHGPPRRDVESADGWERFIAATAAMAEDARAAGVTLGLENVGRCALGRVRDVAAFARRLEEIGSPQDVGFVFDPFQAADADANPFMMLASMGNRLVNVHLSDYSTAAPHRRHLPPGEGDLPWAALARAIAGSGYRGPMILEGNVGRDPHATMAGVHATLDPVLRTVFPFQPDGAQASDLPEALPDGLRQGISLFNQRRFYEQHEVIEHEWHAESRPIRRLYQGILQIGVGFHHAMNGNYRGAVSLLQDGSRKVADFPPETLGIDTARLVRETDACLEQITALGEAHLDAFERDLIPTIHVEDALA